MKRDTVIQLIAGLACVICFAASGVLATALTSSAGEHKLVYADRAEESDPPQVGLGIAMGAFRGVFVNFLWIRANELKEQGRYYEAIDLASAITKLQPRFPRVWAFHAWNMAYNISVATQTVEERWQWVEAGIRLLRDEGIPANPNDMLLHKELAWIYLHKISGWTDDANRYYKRKVAGEWTVVLGPPPPPDFEASRSREMEMRRFADWLRVVAEAPDTLTGVIRKEPAVEELVSRLRNGVGVGLDSELLRRYERQRSISEIGARSTREVRYSERGRAFKDLYEDERYAAAWDALIPHVRKRVLVDEYHMEPYRMIRYTLKYGPIDWRHPAAHSLYWSARGVEEALTRKTERNEQDFDFLNTDRVVMQSVQELYRYGEVFFDFHTYITQPNNPNPFYIALPNVHFVPAYKDILDEVVERAGIFEDKYRRVFRPLGLGYENFMKDAIRLYYRRGEVKRANDLKNELATWEGMNINDPRRAEKFAAPIDEFIKKDLEDRWTSPNVALSEVAGALQGAMLALMNGDREQFDSQWEYATIAHGIYLRQQVRETVVGRAEERMRIMPRDLRLLAGPILVDLISLLSIEQAETLYARAPDGLKRLAYDDLQRFYRERLDNPDSPRSFDEVFPEPPGMESFRRSIERARQQELEDYEMGIERK